MGGFLGIGGNGPDKQKEAAAQNNLTNVFNTGMKTGGEQQASGTSMVSDAADYFKRLMGAGRTDTAAMAAPAVNAATAQADATRTAEAVGGTGRGGGTASANRNAGMQTQSTVDNIINENLQRGRQIGAQGLEATGGLTLQNALAQLGIGTGAEGEVLHSAQADRAGVRNAQTQIWQQVISKLL